MSMDTIKNALPEYARDLKLNLSSLARDEALSEQQRWGAMLACAIAARNPVVIAAVEAEAGRHLSPEAVAAARTAAAIMAMNNVYYRFVHLVSDDAYAAMPAGLRMNALARPGVDRTDFELWSLAVSAVNGCGLCIDAHTRELGKAGLGKEAVQAAVRIAAVIHAVAVTLEGETASAAHTAAAA